MVDVVEADVELDGDAEVDCGLRCACLLCLYVGSIMVQSMRAKVASPLALGQPNLPVCSVMQAPSTKPLTYSGSSQDRPPPNGLVHCPGDRSQVGLVGPPPWLGQKTTTMVEREVVGSYEQS